MSRLRKAGGAVTGAGLLAVAIVGHFEGFRTKAYRDVVGVPTICYGETKNVHMGEKLTKAECDDMLVARLNEFANGVERAIKRPMSDKTEVAFVSLAYNIGEGGFAKSSVVRLYNRGEYRAACDAMMRFNRAGGRTIAALTSRRKAERKLCLEGIAR